MAVGVLDSFHPPAYLDDFQEAGLKKWDETVDGWLNAEIGGEPGGIPRTKLTQFFNPKVTAYEQEQTPVPITWVGFPLKLRMSKATDDARWAAAEDPKNQVDPTGRYKYDREMMDEYCEWSTKKDANGDVSIASFTCEGPEYWTTLAEYYPIKSTKAQPGQGSDKILEIYKSLNPDFADQIQAEDLVDESGNYNTHNKWNESTDTGTIAHLIQRNNALSAEVDIGAQATILRKDLAHGKLITNVIELCGNGSAYGNAKRNSDPTIGGEINTLARLGVGISIADPIALYFHATDFASFRLDPTGLRRSDVKDMIPVPEGVFTYPRGDITKGYGLHIKVKVPNGMKATKVERDLNVSDLFDLNNGGQYVRYGSQFADYIFMAVSGIVSAKPPGIAPMQDSLTYTEPLLPQPFPTDVQSISRKAKLDEELKKRAAAEKAPEPVFTNMRAAAPRNPPSRIKITKRTE